MDGIAVILILALSSFLPPLVYMMWLRNSERFSKEPWMQVFKVFAWGAIFGVIIAIVLSAVFLFFFDQYFPRAYLFGWDGDFLQSLFLVVIIAPFVEEFAKGIGVYTAHYEITEAEDGMVYGASAGLGFAATENLMYGFLAYSLGGLQASLVLIGVRSISSAFLHASASAIMGYGIGRSIVTEGRLKVFPFYFLAVLMHATFNYVASLQEIYPDENIFGVSFALMALVIAIVFAVAAITVVRLKIMKVDSMPGYY